MRHKTLALLIATNLYTVTSHAGAASNRHKPIQPRLTQEQQLGQTLYMDRDLSRNRNQSCATCHSLEPAHDLLTRKKLPSPGFVDPDNVVQGTPVSAGSVAGHFGRLNTPSAGYAAFSPFFHWNGDEGLYIGGQFWNGRANTLAEQAGAPFLNPDEMAMPSAWAVISRLKEKHQYQKLFRKLYDLDLDAVPAYEDAPATLMPPPGVGEIYTRLTQAIAAFEKGPAFNRFTSKFDFYLAGQAQLTDQESLGFAVFQDETKGNCAACHLSAPTIAADGNPFPPLFTDFTYDNIGVPRNVNIPGNPEPDPGLGGRADIAARNPTGELGKHKVMSLRNIALTPPYAHNGVFKTLEQIVHFYNTRDVLGAIADNNDPGFGTSGWPAPEVAENVNTDELGNLGLTTEEETALVAFMKTLTDGYPDWGKDPNVPPGTPSPYATTPFPPMP